VAAVRARHIVLGLVLVAYLAAGLAYALITPLWQAPDEPAHFNYVRHLAEQEALPVLQAGDYPAANLEELKAAHWPPEADVSGIRYEGHQPPLYYLLATPVMGAVRGASVEVQVWTLRLFTVLIGAAALVLTYRLGRVLWPARPGRAIALVAFSAFLPMHTAVSAAVNNDLLAESLVIAAVILAARLAFQLRVRRRGAEPALGVVLGLCLLTKTTAYIALPLVAVALLVRHVRSGGRRGRLLGDAVRVGAPAAVVWLPWVGRNLAVYGINDPLGLARHDAVVSGQLTTAERLSQVGLAAHLADGIRTGFRSFWGVFGWMGVPMHEPVYLALAVATAITFLGLALAAARSYGRASGSDRVRVVLLAAWGLFSFLGVLWYNMKYVQFQGRYLFSALPVWGAATVLGWETASRRPLPVAAGLAGLAAVAALTGLLQGDIPGLVVALLLAAAAGVIAWAWLTRRVPPALGLPLAGLWGLDAAGALYYVQRFL